jgi:hypothetical protein
MPAAAHTHGATAEMDTAATHTHGTAAKVSSATATAEMGATAAAAAEVSAPATSTAKMSTTTTTTTTTTAAAAETAASRVSSRRQTKGYGYCGRACRDFPHDTPRQGQMRQTNARSPGPFRRDAALHTCALAHP